MKKSKWVRLGTGLCLLTMLLIFQGTLSHESKCVFCLLNMGSVAGYLEVHNNTPYNILVGFYGPNRAGPYKLTGNPNYLVKMLDNGLYRVIVWVCTPTPDQEPVLYKIYKVSVPDNYEQVSLTVTTPLGYIPIPKKK